MKYYQAGLTRDVFLKYHELFPNKPLNVLKSYKSFKNEMSFFINNRSKLGSLILDSGTWPLNNSKSADRDIINVATYKDYLEENARHFDFYFNFDDDFTDEGFGNNRRNQLILENSGLKPVPVLHNIYDDELEFYISKGYRRIAMGSSQITGVDLMAHVMRKLDGAGIKIHLLGNARFDFLANFPIDTVDSTTAAKTGAFGDILYWNPLSDGINKTNRIYLEERLQDKAAGRGVFYSRYKFRKEFEAFLHQAFGLEYYDLIGPDGAKNKALVNTYYYVQLEEVINQIHREKGFNTVE